MAKKGIRECSAKQLLASNLANNSDNTFSYHGKAASVDQKTNLDELARENPWLLTSKLVCKPDQLMGKRGKHNLLLLNANYNETKDFLQQKLGSEITIGKTTGILTNFIIEPFLPHEQQEEYYLSFQTHREKDVILFSPHGGVDIEENWDNIISIDIPIGSSESTKELVLQKLPETLLQKDLFADYMSALYSFFIDYGCASLEINPLVFKDGAFTPLDLKIKLDDTSSFENAKKWGAIEFPPAFGLKLSPEEAYINSLDAKTGASLKLTILNPKGRIWTLVAGGGASVIYADTITDLGATNELANYGEYSGNPKTDETYEYTKTILDLMTRERDSQGRSKILLIGGGIANFTDVAKTFTGIIKALREFKQKLIDTNVKIYVRRGGPNYQEGLKKMTELGQELGVPLEVYGPETHMTKIVSLALK